MLGTYDVAAHLRPRPRPHPVDVAEQRVDLAVVAKHAHGLREGPLGHRVRAEAPVVYAELRAVALVRQLIDGGWME